jgi:hypothetical protein
MKKILITTLVVAVLILAVAMAASSFDLMGTLRRMHGH